MFNNLIKNSDYMCILKDGKEYTINNIKKELLALLENSYSSPSYANGKDAPLETLTKEGYWIDAKFNTPCNYLGESIDEILFAIKPKYNFLLVFKKLQDETSSKCITINLAQNTKYILEFLNNAIKENQ